MSVLYLSELNVIKIGSLYYWFWIEVTFSTYGPPDRISRLEHTRTITRYQVTATPAP